MRVDRSRPPQPGPVPSTRFPAVRVDRLANGLPLRTVEHSGPPVVTFQVTIPVGSASDPVNAAGLASLTADLCDEGTVDYTGLELSAALDAIGARLGIGVGTDATIVSLTTVSRHAVAGLALLAEIVARPRFDVADVERVRGLRQSRLRQMRTVSAAVAQRVFLETLYPGHPYGHLGIGTDESLARLERADVVQFHRDAFTLGPASLIAGGALSHDEFADAAESIFGGLPADQPAAGVVTNPAALAAAGAPTARLLLVDRPGAVQSELRIGHVAVDRQTPDFHALLVLNMVLGGQFVSRLNQSLREDKGCTYGVRTAFDCRRAAGPFALQGSVQADATVDAIREVLTQLAAIGTSRPVTPPELDLAKAGLTRGFASGFETVGQVVRGIGQLVLHDLPAKYYDLFVPAVETVDVDAVTAAATAHLHADRAVVVIVGPADEVAPGLEALGLGEPVRIGVRDVVPVTEEGAG